MFASRFAVLPLILLLGASQALAEDSEAVLLKFSVQEARLPAVEKLIAEADASGLQVAYLSSHSSYDCVYDVLDAIQSN